MIEKLPIGIQTFSKIREDKYIYIDKTKEALDLIQNYQYAFLSRPRRFGKSLFLDTLRNIFEGKKEFFEGLYIYDKWDWEKRYPVIYLRMNFEFLMLNDYENKVIQELNTNAKLLGVEIKNDGSASIIFSQLIFEVYKKYNKRVVILIDDWDYPIREYEHKELKELHYFLVSLYIVTKDSDEFIEFAFATGVHPIKADMLIGFNNFTDISINKKYGNICGFTDSEIKQFKIQNSTLKIKQWYNGYYFLKDRVYNPFDILQFIQNDFKFSNYWFATGTPTFLIKLIEKNSYFLPKLSNLKVGKELLDSFDIDNIKLEVILYQSGYLTIDEAIQSRRGMEYKLKFPNEEVKISFFDYVIDFLTNQQSQRLTYQDNLYDALVDANLEAFKETLISLFASIPYNNYTNNKIYEYEGFYASVIYSYLQSLGLEIVGEDVTNLGRIDLTIFIEDKIYIMEFKVVESEKTSSALQQIKEKNYHQKYTKNQKPKTIYLLGIEFSKEDKNICSFEWERV